MITAFIILLLTGWGWTVSRTNSPVVFPTAGAAGAMASKRKQFAGLQTLFVKRAAPVWPFPLKAWANELGLKQNLSEGMSSFIIWLNSLSDAQVDDFARGLAQFFDAQGLDAAWLLECASHDDDAILSVLMEMLEWYALAVQSGQNLQQYIWQPGNRAFVRQLYARLVEVGLASTPGDLLWASEKQRYVHMLQAIQTAAQQQRASVMALVFELLARHGDTGLNWS